MPDTHYINPKLVELYDYDSGWSVDRDFYLAQAKENNMSILDLGCGTGLIANAYAKAGHQVTGVDPSNAMLDSGRKKDHGNKIEWIQDSSQTFKLNKSFDLIIMTGHAFQVLLTDSDLDNTFKSMHSHLKQNGVIVFESRNPSYDWSKDWNYVEKIEIPNCCVQESREFLYMEEDKMTFLLKYDFGDEQLESKSVLRFWSQKQIEEHLKRAELKIKSLFGDWDQSPFDPNLSKEMIFIVGK